MNPECCIPDLRSFCTVLKRQIMPFYCVKREYTLLYDFSVLKELEITLGISNVFANIRPSGFPTLLNGFLNTCVSQYFRFFGF